MADRRPGRMTKTDEQLEDIIEFVANLVARRLQKRHVKEAVRQYCTKTHGLVVPTWRTIENWIVRARALLLKRSQRPREEHKNDALAFYESVIASDAHPRVKIAAQERIDKLFGLEAPTKHQVDVPGAGVFVVGGIDVDAVTGQKAGLHAHERNGDVVKS